MVLTKLQHCIKIALVLVVENTILEKFLQNNLKLFDLKHE